MNSFTLFTPTRIHFGADQLDAFARATARLGKHAFVVTGGGTVKRLGILAQVSTALGKNGLQLSQFSGIEPNPDAVTINRATIALRTAQADCVIAIGGGSVVDAAKAIAALAYSGESDIWPYVLGGPRAMGLDGALPIAAVTTTAATASEVTPYAIISKRAAQGKSILIGEFLKPRTAWLNPAFTVGLSAQTTQDGAADILSHVLENYLLGGSDSPMADRYSEGIMATVLETLPQLLANPADLAARGNLLWASTLALNDYQNAGRNTSEIVLHALEHALSAYNPELAHGRGLATLYPAYFRWLLSEGRAVNRFAQLGERLFGMTGSEAKRAEGFIVRFEQWLRENQLLQSLGQLGFDAASFPAIADYAVRTYGDGRQLNALGALPPGKISALFRSTERQAIPSPSELVGAASM